MSKSFSFYSKIVNLAKKIWQFTKFFEIYQIFKIR